MRPLYSLGAAVFLAACSASSTPPGGTCATRASFELSALQAAIQTAETNLDRGYILIRKSTAESPQIEILRYSLNVPKERQKLASLQARLGDIQAKTDVALAQCAGA